MEIWKLENSKLLEGKLNKFKVLNYLMFIIWYNFSKGKKYAFAV